MHHDYEESKFIRDAMVLNIVEQSFPHRITFLLLEPSSHMQWQHVIDDDKLNQIETRHENEYFVKNFKSCLERGVLGLGHQVNSKPNDDKDKFKIGDVTKIRVISTLGFQKEHTENVSTDIWNGNLKSLFNDSNSLIYAKNIQIKIL